MNLKQLDLNLLVYFNCVYVYGSVSKAAEHLCISQSALSHGLARLRQQLGDPLFVRINNCMTPTPRAQDLASQLAQALPLIETALISPVQFVPSTSTRTFTIVATDYTEFSLLPTIVSHLAQIAPNVSLRILPASSENIEAILEDHSIDFALGFVHHDFQSSTINCQSWLTDNYVTLTSNTHPIISDSMTLEHFTAIPHILIAPWGEKRGIVDEVLSKKGLSRKIALQLPSVLVAPHVVASSHYLLTLPAKIGLQIHKDVDCNVFTPPVEIPKYHLNIYWHKINSEKPEIKWFVSMVTALFNPNQTI